MKCPKCRYITFDEGDRCRNCGYDFSLSVDATDLDLPIKTGDEALGPLADFGLGTHQSSTVPLTPAPSDPTPQVSRRARTPELPLFVDRGLDDDRPLVSLPASPRAPVAVRKSTAARGLPQRAPAEEPELDLVAPAAPRRPIAGPPAQRL